MLLLPRGCIPQATPKYDADDGNIPPEANAQTVRDTVAAPIEEQVSGVENMLYMSSQCTNDGAWRLATVAGLGMDTDMAQVLVQNRVLAGLR